MPAEKGSRLNNEERLFPVRDGSHKQQQEESIGPGTRWALDLTTEHDELLTEQGVFGDECSSGPGQIGKRSC